MNSIFGFIVGLLQAALSLLGFVQQHPDLPPAAQQQAQQVAQQAITQATQTLASNPQGQGSSQLSKDLANITPQFIDVNTSLSAAILEKIKNDIIAVLIAQDPKNREYYTQNGVALFAVGKRYIVFYVQTPTNRGSSLQIMDAVTQRSTNVISGQLLFKTNTVAVYVDDKNIYTYSPDQSTALALPGAKLLGNETYDHCGGCMGSDRDPQFTRLDASFTISTYDWSQGIKDQTGRVTPKKIRDLTFALSSEKTPGSAASANWKTYANARYGFSLQYPADKVRVVEANENNNHEVAYLGLTSHEAYRNPWLNELTVSVFAGDCRGYETRGSGYEFIKKVQLGTETFDQANVSVDYNGMNSHGQYVLAYCLAKNGIVYEIRDRSGGGDPTIEQVLHTFKLIPSSNDGISVPGMSKYTDTDFGFSFWYPSDWTVETWGIPNPGYYPGGTITKKLRVGPGHRTDPQNSISIEEYTSSDRTVTDPDPGVAPMGHPHPAVRYYFDADAHTWMMQFPNGAPSEKDGSLVTPPGWTGSADVSQNTIGGLHMLYGSQGDTIIPLSARNFLIVGAGLAPSLDKAHLTKTIVAIDPSVATPVSVAEQIKAIQAEKNAYVK